MQDQIRLKQACTLPSAPSDDEIQIHGVPLSQYFLTEAEVAQNIENKDWFLKKILHFGSAIALIRSIEHLVPNPISNTLFSGLVLLVREFPKFSESHVLENVLVQQLRDQVIENCGIAEYYLEAFYANRIIAGEVTLQQFPYYENYELLMSFEAKCIRGYLGSSLFRHVRKVAFIGSGPLPLSSLEIIRHLPKAVTVVNYDQSAEAVEFGQTIVATQNLSHRISFVTSSAQEIEDLGNVDIVYLAALAGGNAAEKKEITDHLYKIMRPFSILVARSSAGLRSFIYQRLTLEDFGRFKGFRHFDPTNKVIINSIAIGMKLDV